jgi:hypothetical protein
VLPLPVDPRAAGTPGELARARREQILHTIFRHDVQPSSERPTGPLNIQHFHSRGLSLRNLYLGAPDLAVVRYRIVFNLVEHPGNVCMTELPAVRE